MLFKLYSFDNFLFENIDTTYFIISDGLFDVLMEIDHPISTKLMANNADNIQKKVTFIDLVMDEYDKWSFVNSVKANQYIEDKGKKSDSLRSLYQYKDTIIDKFSSKTKIGRIINKIYPEVFTTIEIEKFVHLYKKQFANTFDLLDIVKGDDIKKWYDCKNYNKSEYSTELTNSCMAASKKNEYMDFYAVNDDRVSMLILYSDKDKNKIDARAILWKPDTIDGKKNTKGELFLDRIYFNNQDHKNIMQRYADINGWYYKNNGIYNPHTKEVRNTKFHLKNMRISPSHKMPYADTLDIFDPKTNTLSNDYQNCDNYGCLGSTGGGLDGLEWVESKKRFYHENDLSLAQGINGREYIPTEDAIYLPRYNKNYTKEYIKEHELVNVQDPIEVECDGEYKAPYYEVFKEDTIWSEEYHNRFYIKDVKYSDFFRIYIPKNKAIFSRHMDTYIPIDDTVKVITDIVDGYEWDVDDWVQNKNSFDYYLKDDPGKPFFKYKDGKYYLKSLKNKLKELKNEKN